MLRKRRTREHIIADLSVHHVEGVILRQGWTVEKFWHDYGYDLAMYTYNEQGEPEAENILFQLKATDNLTSHEVQAGISWTVDVRDLRLWHDETMPVILVVYDATEEVAYWVLISDIIKQRENWESHSYVNAVIPKENKLDNSALNSFRIVKNDKVMQRRRNYHVS
jgi:Domain of unknown function (DUF4365)